MRYPDAEVRSRSERAVRLALAGRSYDDIATELGYANRSGAWKAVNRALKARTDEAVDEYRALELSRLEELMTAYYPRAVRGDLSAALVCLKLIEAEARLLALGNSEVSEPKATYVVIPPRDGHQTCV